MITASRHCREAVVFGARQLSLTAILRLMPLGTWFFSTPPLALPQPRGMPCQRATSQPELSLDRKETSRLVQEILSKLPEGQQMILGMRYYDELSVKEIARLLNRKEWTVRKQLVRGKAMLQERYERRS